MSKHYGGKNEVQGLKKIRSRANRLIPRQFLESVLQTIKLTKKKSKSEIACPDTTLMVEKEGCKA